MSIVYAFLVIAWLLPVNADRWYVNWLELECVSHEKTPMPFWSVVYKSKKEVRVLHLVVTTHCSIELTISHRLAVSVLREDILVERKLRGYTSSFVHAFVFADQTSRFRESSNDWSIW